MKTRLKILMTRKAFESIAVILGILLLGALGMATWGTLVVILVACLVLNYGIPDKYTPHIATLEAMLVAGGLAALLLITLFEDITSWLIWAGVLWLVDLSRYKYVSSLSFPDKSRGRKSDLAFGSAFKWEEVNSSGRPWTHPIRRKKKLHSCLCDHSLSRPNLDCNNHLWA